MRTAALGVSVLTAIVVALPQSTIGQQTAVAAPRLPRGVAERARREGSVRVIVGVRAPFVPEGRLSARGALDQRAAIHAAQRRVIDQLTGLLHSAIRQFQTIPFLAVRVSPEALERLAALGDVATIEENAVDSPTLAESTALIGASIVLGSGYTGDGWTVAVLDTGVQEDHPFLSGAIAADACYSNDGGTGGGTSLCPALVTASASPGSAANCDTYAFDGCDHGTHVAGIAVGRRSAGGSAFSGVAPSAALINIQVFTGFTGMVGSYVSDQIAALERVYALRHTFRIAAVNMSLGSTATYDAPCDVSHASRKAIIDQLRAAGIATVVAAGNSAANGLSAPACISSAISVGSTGDGSATQTMDVVSSFSNSSPFLSLMAPGAAITSSVPRSIYAALSGTSMAAPHVAGGWALMKQRKPLAPVDEVLNAFAATGTPILDRRYGGPIEKPRIDVNRALNALRVDDMAVDVPSGASRQAQPFTMSGWAINMSAPMGGGPGVDAVHVWAFPASGAPLPVGAAAYGLLRGDVGNVYGSQFASSGWSITVRGLPPGVYTLNAYARNTFDGTFSQVRTIHDVTVPGQPEVHVDSPVTDAVVTKPFEMSGWAIDRAAVTGTGIDAVHVWAHPRPGSGTPPIFVGSASYGIARLDVGATLGSQFTSSGWSVRIAALPAGPHQIVAYARSAGTNTFDAVRSVFVTLSELAMALDEPRDGNTLAAPSPVTISGWAIDLGSSGGPGVNAVHVWRYPEPGSGAGPVFVGLATYGLARPDVGTIFGARFTNSGYALTAMLPPGTHRLAIFPQSSLSGAFTVHTVDVKVTAAR